MIELSGLNKKFAGRPAVIDLDLQVPKGSIYGLLGHNGAGKSTTIGMMLGMVWPTSGAIRINGHDIANHRQQAMQRVGAIFESPVFYDYLSGWKNLQILSHYTARTPDSRIREVVKWVGLEGREQHKVRTYSHGMRARLALAQALLPDPELLILDEPSDGLDPEGIHEMRETILRLHRELNLTILFSSHLLTEVEQLCTRIAIMNKGRKVYEGTVAEARAERNRVRFKTADFPATVQYLREQRLIDAHHDGRYIVPLPNVTVDEIVRSLVGANIPVHEIAPEEQTLEDFYISLMQQSRAAAS